MGKNLTDVLREAAEKPELGRRQPNRLLIKPDFAAHQVYHQIAIDEIASFGAIWMHVPSQ
jgi:hypothetical protein